MRAITLPMDADEEVVTPPAPAADALQRLLLPTNRIILQAHVYLARLAAALRYEGQLTSLQRRDTQRLSNTLAPLVRALAALLSHVAHSARTLSLRQTTSTTTTSSSTRSHHRRAPELSSRRLHALDAETRAHIEGRAGAPSAAGGAPAAAGSSSNSILAGGGAAETDPLLPTSAVADAFADLTLEAGDGAVHVPGEEGGNGEGEGGLVSETTLEQVERILEGDGVAPAVDRALELARQLLREAPPTPPLNVDVSDPLSGLADESRVIIMLLLLPTVMIWRV